MASGLSRYEIETVINFNDAESMASISTSQCWMRNRIKKLAEEYPDQVVIKEESATTLFASLPKTWVRLRPPRKMSNEQREELSRRMKEMRKKRDSKLHLLH